MKKLHPTAGWVLIEELPEEEKTSVGVYLPETSKDKSVKGKIVAIGPYMQNENYNLVLYEQIRSAGIVIFKKWATNEVNDNGKKYVLVKFEDVIGYYEDGKT